MQSFQQVEKVLTRVDHADKLRLGVDGDRRPSGVGLEGDPLEGSSLGAHDGVVTGRDLISVQENFGKSSNPAVGESVPEPAAFVVLIAATALARITHELRREEQ